MDKFLEAAIDEAKKGLAEGGIPIGSVLVIDYQIIARGRPMETECAAGLTHLWIACCQPLSSIF